MKINEKLNIKVVFPMLMLVINAKEYEMELIGVVPSVETMENATPKDIKNNPKTNMHTLLNMF